MALLIVAPNRDTRAVREHLQQLDPQLDVRLWPDLGDPAEIDFAVLWKHPPGTLAQLPGLRAVSSYGAGVESILNDPELPPALPVGRISGPRLAADMAEFVAAVVIARHRGLWGFREDQQARRWRPWAPEQLPVIGLLGSGKMGAAVAKVFLALGYPVHAWSRSGSAPAGVEGHAGDAGLASMAGMVDYLVCLLPLTDQTRDRLNADLFARMRRGAYLINVGRGEHLVEDDLLQALDSGQLGGAYLDVFRQEPLPPAHPFWDHPQILMSPHCASYTLPREAARLMLESYQRVQRGELPLDAVDRSAGY
ncbi:MAG: glyoxylate/hydroxypyruvate reductase A [Wenzhouxiangellaceae bacterium]